MKTLQVLSILLALSFSSAFSWLTNDFPVEKTEKRIAKRQAPTDLQTCLNQNTVYTTTIANYRNLFITVTDACNRQSTIPPTMPPTTTTMAPTTTTTKAPPSPSDPPPVPSYPLGRFPNKLYKCPTPYAELAYPIYANDGTYLKSICEWRTPINPMHAAQFCRKYGMEQYAITREEELTQLIEFQTYARGFGTGTMLSLNGQFINGTWMITNPGLGKLWSGAFPQSSAGSLGNCLRIQGTGNALVTATVPCNTGAVYALCEWDLLTRPQLCPAFNEPAVAIYANDGTYLKSFCTLENTVSPADAKVECRKYGMQLFAFKRQEELDQVITYHYQRFGYTALVNVNGFYSNGNWTVNTPEPGFLTKSAIPTTASGGNCLAIQGLGSSIITTSVPCTTGARYSYCEWVRSPYAPV